MGRKGRLDQHPAGRSGTPDNRGGAHHRRCGQGRSRTVDGAGGRWPAAERRIPAFGKAGQLDDRAAFGVHLGSDARGARGWYRRQARRPGQGQGRLRRMERTDRVRQPDGRQSDGAGSKHRRRNDRGCQWRLVQEDHGRRARRNLAAERSHQHDGRSAQVVCVGSDAHGARSRHRRQPRRSGRGARRCRHLEGSHRLRQCDGDQPDGTGPQYRDRDHGGGARRSSAARSRSMRRARFWS